MPLLVILTSRGRRALALALACVVVLAGTPVKSMAQARSTVQMAEGTPWSSLTANQKNTLRPLERDWDSIDGPRKGKWIEMANKLPTMSPEERARVQDRMSDWARLTPR